MKCSEKYKNYEMREWYNLNSLMGNDWAMFYFMIGGREAGKSYATLDMFLRQWVKRQRPFTWMRLTEASAKKLLQNNGEKLIDPDLRRKYKLENIKVKGDTVYDGDRIMCRVLALSTFYNDKGAGLFDKDFLNNSDMYYNICLDEMNKEKCERRTQDILYSFANQLENIIRSTKRRVRIICIGNTLEEAADLLVGINFIPETFGRYKLRKKRVVIDYIPMNEAARVRREGTAASILLGNNSTLTNEIKTDNHLIYKAEMVRPTAILKFSKECGDWFTIWDGNVICPYNKEKIQSIWMRPHNDGIYNKEIVNNVIGVYMASAFFYKNLLTQKKFKKYISLLRPNG